MENAYYNQYLSAPLSATDREDVEKDKAELISQGAFSSEPTFGTGGMRALTGNGSNRLNRYNIVRLNMALGNVLKEHKKTGIIVIGYDSRLTSPLFSKLSYFSLRDQGFNVKIFRRPSPTPLLSFAVREMKATAGIVITASHNPPAYNGYKVYWADGAQIVPPIDSEIQKTFLETHFSSLTVKMHDWENMDISQEDLIEEEIYSAYLEKLKSEKFVTKGVKKTCILYSPLHGTGGWIFEQTFKELGFKNFQVLAEQKEPNGSFPTVKSPNPEEPSAFTLLVEEGKKIQADVLLATDPDADRVGAMIREGNTFHFLTGNQIGSLLLESIGRNLSGNVKSPYICKTIVTTELQRLIADKYKIQTVETLTGFKYIADVIGKDPDNYVFGGEESFGYLPVPWVRDKDSVSSAVALAELASTGSLTKILDEIYLSHGIFVERLHNIDLTANPAQASQIMNDLKNPSTLMGSSVGTRKISDILDFRANSMPALTEYGQTLKKNLGQATVVQFWLEKFGRITIRPSGTEPKIKIYLSIESLKIPTVQNLQSEKLMLNEEADSLLKQVLKKLNVS